MRRAWTRRSRARRSRQERRLPGPQRTAVVHRRNRARAVGPAVPRAPAAGPARVRADPRTRAHGTVDARRPAVPHPPRAREDMTFEFERQLLDVLGDAATVVDETTGFRYFDARDLLGFVDGTANPTGAELPDAALIGEDADPDFAGRADPDAAGRAGDGGPGERIARHRLAARRDLTR